MAAKIAERAAAGAAPYHAPFERNRRVGKALAAEPRRIGVHRPDLLAHDAPCLLHGVGKPVDKAHHIALAIPLCGRSQRAALLDVHRHRLFDEKMPARLDGAERILAVERVRHADAHRVHAVEQLSVAFAHGGREAMLADPVARAVHAGVIDRRDLGPAVVQQSQRMEVGDAHNISGSDDADTYHGALCSFSPYFLNSMYSLYTCDQMVFLYSLNSGSSFVA